MFPAAKLCRRKSVSGSIGWEVRASQTRNAANSTAPTARGSATAGAPQPRSGCSIRPKVIPASPSAHRSAPTASTRASGSRSRACGTTRRISTIVTSTIGTLIAKIQRQEAVSTSCPPISGPSTVPIPPQAVQAPTAFPRSSGAKFATMTASAAGVSTAPATPCRARAATRNSTVGASAHASEVAPKPPTPRAKTRRSPKMSPSDPPMRSSEPSVTRYAFEVHCCPASPPPRSSSIAGRATLTTVASTVTTVVPRMAATRMSVLLGAEEDASIESLRVRPGAVDRVRRPRPRARVAGGGTDQPALALLLEDVRGPARHPRTGEHRREQLGRHVGVVEHDGGPELDVRGQHAVRLARLQLGERGLLEPLGHLQTRRSDLARRAAQHAGAWVLGPVHAVAKAHQPLARVERILDPALGVARALDLVEHVEHARRRPAVQRAGQRAHPRGQGGGHVGARGGDDARREGRR